MKKILLLLSALLIICFSCCSSGSGNTSGSSGVGGFGGSFMDAGMMQQSNECIKPLDICSLESNSTIATNGVCKEFQGNFVCSSCGNDVEVNEITYQDQFYCTKCQLTKDGKYAHWEKLSIMECQ